MDNQSVFDMLSELECFFYYESNSRLNPTIDDIHDKIKSALIAWSEFTGCTNQ